MSGERRTGHTGEALLPLEFVEKDYFLCRIREFEQKYNLGWGEFLARYSTGQLEADSSTGSDFTEWAFLCHNFMRELINVENSGPPGQMDNENLQEPEQNSGSFILR